MFRAKALPSSWLCAGCREGSPELEELHGGREVHWLFPLTFRKAICQSEMNEPEIIISLCIIKGCIDKLSDWPSALWQTPLLNAAAQATSHST